MSVVAVPRKKKHAEDEARGGPQRDFVQTLYEHDGLGALPDRLSRPNDLQYFFFSSRRRHTSSTRDWSSDVCSSDLLADVEWTVQLLQLRLGRDHPGVRQPGTLAALAALQEQGALDATEAAWLADAYRLCLRIRNAAYLVTGRPADSLPTDQVVMERLAQAMGEPAPGRQRLLEAYRRATRRARRVVT